MPRRKEGREAFDLCVTMIRSKNPVAGKAPEQVAGLLTAMTRLEKEVFPELEKFAKQMRASYGADEAAFAAKMEALQKDAPSNSPVSYYLKDSWPKLVKLEAAMKNAPALRVAMAEVLLANAQMLYERAAKTLKDCGSAEQDVKMMQDQFLAVVPSMKAIIEADPQNATAKELVDRATRGAESVVATIDKAIDAADWVGRTKTFSGPGNPDELEKSIITFARGGGWVGSEKNAYTTLAVAIDGEWYSHKRNVLGQTTQWGLPMRVATKRASDKGNDVVKVWFLSVLTKEEPGVAKAAPWSQFAVGDGYRMRQAKFDQQVKK